MRNINITHNKITKYIYKYRNFNYKESTIFRVVNYIVNILLLKNTSQYWSCKMLIII